MALERWTYPKRSRRTSSPRCGLHSSRGKPAGGAKRPREHISHPKSVTIRKLPPTAGRQPAHLKSPTRNPYRHDSQTSPHRWTSAGPPQVSHPKSLPSRFANFPPPLDVSRPSSSLPPAAAGGPTRPARRTAAAPRTCTRTPCSASRRRARASAPRRTGSRSRP
jgi:hypothetical protein